jgi:mannosyltransferase
MRKPMIQREWDSTEPRRHTTLAILAALLVTALALRLYDLGDGLWVDEILTYVNYMKMPVGQIMMTYDDQNQHLLYTVLARASCWIFGESPWSLRLPAVLFGVGGIWGLYLLGLQVGSAREALLSAALLTFSYHHIWFSQNARGYTGLLFWTILSSWLLLRALQQARPQLWLAYAPAVALGVYTHMTMLFVIFGHFSLYLMTLFARRREIWPHRGAGFFLGFGLAGFLTLLLYALVLPQVFAGMLWQGATSAVTVWKNPLWTLSEFAKGIEMGFGGSIVVVAALFVFGAGLLSFARKNPAVIQFLMIPPIVGTAVLMSMGHPLWPRVFFFSIGFAVLVVIRGSMLLGHMAVKTFRLSPRKSELAGTALCIGLIAISATSIPAVYGPKQDYLGALTYIQENASPGDAIVTTGVATFPYQKFYNVDWKAVETLESLNAIRSYAKRTWLLYTFPVHLEYEYTEIMASIRRDFTVVNQYYGTLGGGTIFICRVDSTPF